VAERAALVTGGSSGIGLAIARALGQDGYGVTLSARRPEKLEAAAEGLRGEGLDVNSVPANMADEDDIKGVFDSHRERFGRLDVLVNSAWGGYERMVEDGRFTWPVPFWQQPLWRWEAMITVGVRGAAE